MIQSWGMEWDAGTFIAWFLWGLMVVAALAMVAETRKRIGRMQEMQELRNRFGNTLSDEELRNLYVIEQVKAELEKQKAVTKWQFHCLEVTQEDYLSLRTHSGECYHGVFMGVVAQNESLQSCCLIPYEIDQSPETGRMAGNPVFIPLETIDENSVFSSRHSK